MVTLTLADLCHVVAAEMAQGGPSASTEAVTQVLGQVPDAPLVLARHILEDRPAPPAKTRSKKTKGVVPQASEASLKAAHMLLMTYTLEQLRFSVESRKADAIAMAERLRADLLEAAGKATVAPEALMMILQAFNLAKLDIGDALRNAVPDMIASQDDEALGDDDLRAQFSEIAREMRGDVFATHAMLDSMIQAMPDHVKVKAIGAMFSDEHEALREAAAGWLLDPSAKVRNSVIERLVVEFEAGALNGVILRRLIAMRNWLPESERANLDRAIAAGRKKMDCAALPSVKAPEVSITAIDGGGAQSVMALAPDGRKRAFVSLLFKQGIGVRDVMVQRGVTKSGVSFMFEAMASQMTMTPTTVAVVGELLRRNLGGNLRSGVLPPFGAIEAAELLGVTDINPSPRDLEDLIAELCDGLTDTDVGAQGIAGLLKARDEYLNDVVDESWFDDSDAAAEIVATTTLSAAKRKTALLDGPLQKQRRWWAELTANTAWTLKHTQGSQEWRRLAVIARALLEDTPLAKIGLMQIIANRTIAAHRGH